MRPPRARGRGPRRRCGAPAIRPSGGGPIFCAWARLCLRIPAPLLGGAAPFTLTAAGPLWLAGAWSPAALGARAGRGPRRRRSRAPSRGAQVRQRGLGGALSRQACQLARRARQLRQRGLAGGRVAARAARSPAWRRQAWHPARTGGRSAGAASPASQPSPAAQSILCRAVNLATPRHAASEPLAPVRAPVGRRQRRCLVRTTPPAR